MACPNRIGPLAHHNDGNRIRSILGTPVRNGPSRCRVEISLQPPPLGRKGGQPPGPALGIPTLHADVLALDPAMLAQPCPERLPKRQDLRGGRRKVRENTYPG